MNKHLHNSLRALFLSLAVLLSLPMLAEQVEINGINYDLDTEAKQATVIAKFRDKYSGEVVIPESVKYREITYSVTSIGDKAFNDDSDLTSITIPNSVTSIGSHAFYNCEGLTSLTIPNSVETIGEWAFCYCSGLTSVTIGSGVKEIADGAFYLCTGLTSVHISDIAAWCNIDYHGGSTNPLVHAHRLYLNGEEVRDLVIPNIVTRIANNAFQYCKSLVSVTIPNSVTSIGDWAFDHCSGLTSITIPNSVTNIGSHVFYYCDGLTSVTIGNSVESIEESAFRYCSGLTSVTIPNSVESIGNYAFSECDALTSVTIPNSVESVGDYAFSECDALTSVTIGNSVKSIGERAFDFSYKLHDVYCYTEDVPSTDNDVFSWSNYYNATLHVPAASINSYKATAPWSSFGNIVALPNYFNLTVSSAGYATLYLDFNAEIPAAVQAYTGVKVVGNRLKMERVEGVLPANTGVIIKAEEGTYTFAESDATPATIGDNLLYGTVATTQISTDPTYSYYVLSKVDGIVGMYLAKLTDGKFQNNANKAYMMLKKGDLGIYDEGVDTGTEQLSRGFVFDFGEETSIDELKSEDGKVKSAVYDLSGRRVQKAQKGVYIQNGKVVLVR